MSASSNVSLSIAALQNRKRTQMLLGVALLGVLVFTAGGLFLYAPETSRDQVVQQQSSKPDQTPTQSSHDFQHLLNELATVEPQLAIDPKLDELLELLEGDTVYGELVREIRHDLANNRMAPSEKIDSLKMVVKEKVRSIDKALSQAMQANNAVLIERLSVSNFFVRHAIDQLPKWAWVATTALGEYKLAISTLVSAEASGDQRSVLSELESIRKLTGYAGHDGRISALRRQFEDQYEERVKLTILSHMESGDYDLALQTAKKHAPLVSKNASLKDLVTQASAAKERALRDDAVANAAEFARRDEWASAVQAAKSIPAELRAADIDEIIETGEKILSAQKTLSSLTSRPERLTDSNVKQYARKQITAASALMHLSPTLTRAVTNLSTLLEEASGTLSVTILSDDRATILIPGLGYIEPTSKKVLDLQYAKYKFIIRCDNKRDTFEYLDLRETPSGESPTIRLMCET